MSVGNPYGHSNSCQCDKCQEWDDVQLGISALAKLKESKAKKTLVDCEFCGGSYPSLDTSCPNCGARRRTSQPLTPATGAKTVVIVNGKKQCSSCGWWMNADARFCPNCGVRQG